MIIVTVLYLIMTIESYRLAEFSPAQEFCGGNDLRDVLILMIGNCQTFKVKRPCVTVNTDRATRVSCNTKFSDY